MRITSWIPRHFGPQLPGFIRCRNGSVEPMKPPVSVIHQVSVIAASPLPTTSWHQRHTFGSTARLRWSQSVTLAGVSTPKPDQRLSTFAEWNEHLHASPDRRPDDTPVIGGQKGRPRRATREELLELIRRCEAKEAAESGGE